MQIKKKVWNKDKNLFSPNIAKFPTPNNIFLQKRDGGVS